MTGGEDSEVSMVQKDVEADPTGNRKAWESR